jgi:hypothetical protein
MPSSLGAKKYLGERVGDIDGDHLLDTLVLYQCSAASEADERKLIVDVGLGGGTFEQVLTDKSDLAGWIGLADVNGDGRDDVLAVSSGGAHDEVVVPLQYVGGRLDPVRGDFDRDGLTIDAALSSVAGFTCKKIDGRAAIVVHRYVDPRRIPARRAVRRDDDDLRRGLVRVHAPHLDRAGDIPDHRDAGREPGDAERA